MISESDLFVPPGVPCGYDGCYPPQPMLLLSDLRRLQARQDTAGLQSSWAACLHNTVKGVMRVLESWHGLPPVTAASLPPALQRLDVACAYLGGGSFGCHTFDTERLAALGRLTQLVLRGFEEPCLWGLPPSLRVLRVLGGRLNETLHDPVRFPRHMFALPNYTR